jgi:hypothetical protein
VETAGHFLFRYSEGDGFALVIAERLEVPLDLLPDWVLANAQAKDPNARIVFKEKRHVHGVDVWFIKMEAEANGIPFVYLNYDYGGKAGTVQVMTYTGRKLFGEFEKDFLDFLNGLSVSE